MSNDITTIIQYMQGEINRLEKEVEKLENELCLSKKKSTTDAVIAATTPIDLTAL